MSSFTNAEVKKVLEAFNEAAPNAKCSLCGSDNFQLYTGVITLPYQHQYPADPDNKLGLVLGGPNFPCVPIICGTCGNVYTVNLLILAGGKFAYLVTRAKAEEGQGDGND